MAASEHSTCSARLSGVGLPCAAADTGLLLDGVLRAIQAARSDPSAVAARLKSRITRDLYTGVEYADPRKPVGRVTVTKEGAEAVLDAVRFLEAQSPQDPAGFKVENVPGLALSAEDHADDIGRYGVVSHRGTDGSSVPDRQSRYGAWKGWCGECLWYGSTEHDLSGEVVVDDLIVDDGVRDRGHRLCVFDARGKVAGVAVAPHKIFGAVIAIEFAGGYTPGPESSLRDRHGNGPPVHAVPATKAPKPKTQWKLGGCAGCGEAIAGGAVVEIGERKYHKRCYVCAACGVSVVGQAVKWQAEVLHCKPCWAAAFAPDCAHCGKKVDGSTPSMKAKGKKAIYHKACWDKRGAEIGKQAAKGQPRNGAPLSSIGAKPRGPASTGVQQGAKAPRSVWAARGRGQGGQSGQNSTPPSLRRPLVTAAARGRAKPLPPIATRGNEGGRESARGGAGKIDPSSIGYGDVEGL